MAQSQAVLDFFAEPLKRVLTREAKVFSVMKDNFSSCHDTIGDVANVLDDGEGVEQCKAALLRVLELGAEARAYSSALDGLAQSYQPSLTETDFGVELRRRKELTELRRPYVAAEDRVYFALLRELEARDGGGADEQVDGDDDLVMNTQHELAKNAKCPLSGKPILDIEEPVEDEQGYIYEKVAIVEHIKRQERLQPGRAVVAPIAATAHTVSVATLRRATRVIREQKRLRRGGGSTQVDDGEDEIIDV